MNLLWNTLQVLLVASSVCYAQRTIPKTATAFCWKKSDNEQFTMRFSVLLDSTHPEGELIPIQLGLESRNLNTQCVHTITDNLYLATFDYDINGDTNDPDKCGISRGFDGNIETYTWRIAFVETKNILGDELMYDDLDRIYQFTCREDTLTEVMLSTEINVEAPSLHQNVPITNPEVTLRIYKQRNPNVNPNVGVYDVVTPTMTVVAGCWILMELELALPDDFNINTHAHGIHAYNTIVSGSNTFSPYWRIFDELTGCTSEAQTGGDPVMPWNPTPFQRDSDKTNVQANGRWVIKTGHFRALKYDDSDKMYFKTNFGLCFGEVSAGGNIECSQSCTTSEQGLRRKRSVEAPKEARAELTVIDGDEEFHIGKHDNHENNTAGASSNMTALIVGLVIAGVMTLLTSALVTVVCLMRRRRGKQADRNYNNFNNPPSVVVPTEKH